MLMIERILLLYLKKYYVPINSQKKRENKSAVALIVNLAFSCYYVPRDISGGKL